MTTPAPLLTPARYEVIGIEHDDTQYFVRLRHYPPDISRDAIHEYRDEEFETGPLTEKEAAWFRLGVALGLEDPTTMLPSLVGRAIRRVGNAEDRRW